MGFRLSIYATALTISGYKYTGKLALIRIIRVLVIINLPDRFIRPFWFCVCGADWLSIYPSFLSQIVNLLLNTDSLSVLNVLI